MTTWQIVIPVKRLASAKSRIPLAAERRAELALAMLDDVIASALAAPSVAGAHVVSADPLVRERATRQGAHAIEADESDGLNGDLTTAIAAVRNVAPQTAIAIVVADLPCLRSADLESLLGQAPATGACFVAGIDGGTTMLLARDGGELAPRFGSHSAWSHAQDAITLVDAPLAARIDIDSLEALQSAAEHGVGAQTHQWMNRFSPASAAI